MASVAAFYRFPPGTTVRLIPVADEAEMRPSSNDAAAVAVVGQDGWLRASVGDARYGSARFGEAAWGGVLAAGTEFWAVGTGDESQPLTVRVKAVEEDPLVQRPIQGRRTAYPQLYTREDSL